MKIVHARVELLPSDSFWTLSDADGLWVGSRLNIAGSPEEMEKLAEVALESARYQREAKGLAATEPREVSRVG